jgi:uncharacterized membrane protein
VLSTPELTIDYTVIDNLPGADSTTPYGINAAGDVSGSALVDNYTGSVGFLWHKATNSFTTIEAGTLHYTSAHGINDAGIVVGDYIVDFFDPSDPNSVNIYNGFTFDSTTGSIASGPSFRLRDITEAGDLAGATLTAPDGTTQALRYWHGQAETFSCFGAFTTIAESINVAGDVVGVYFFSLTDPVAKAFLYRNGQCIDISIPGAGYTVAWGMNDRGDIVGYYFDAIWGGTCFSGAFYRHDDQVEVTRIKCGSKFFRGNNSKVYGLFSINNDRVVVGALSGGDLDGRMFYGTLRGAKGVPE